ncbi:hypothetical protein ABZZ44_09125 [Streptomyces sp. NPDC006460]|uniref:hypothetical protein n=1 Tax=Streptomyces sp. NPDC006460 TaxID=3154304 RepID=UPI00339F253E
MTDTTIEPVVAPTAAPEPAQPPPPAPDANTKDVDHTPGGWPAVPLALTGANTTTALLAAAALAGGPIAAAIAATGAVVLGATATHRKNTKTSKKPTSAAKTAGHTARRMAAGRIPQQPKRAGTAAGTGAGAGSHGRKTSKNTRSNPATGATTSTAGRLKKAASRTDSAAHTGSTAGKAPGRVGQVKALRAQARKAASSKATQRAGTAAARRQVADARRTAKAQARTASAARKGSIGRAVGKAAGRVGKAREAGIERARTARDRSSAGQVAGKRDQVRKAPVRKAARKALRRSAVRFQGRRLLAALLGGALGLVGMLSTPLGRKLGWAWLQNPGRRLYARLVRAAGEQRQARDTAIRVQQEADEAAVDAEAADDSTEQIGDQAKRPVGLVPNSTNGTAEGDVVSGFRFEEYAAEMEAAANSYDPESAMEILAMVEGLPAALTSVANVMKILAERADSEFPLEKQVADGFNDIFGALMSAVAVAEDMGPLFRQAHEQDIARHEDPRNGPEAEKGWNV